MAVTAVRPPVIYGHAAKGSIQQLVRAIQWHVPLPLAGISNKRAFVAADNIADFIVHRLVRPTKGFDSFIVADTEQVSTPEFVRRLARAMQQPAHLFPFPHALLKAGFRMLGRGELINSLTRSLEVNLEKLQASGWRPALALDKGLELTFSPKGRRKAS